MLDVIIRSKTRLKLITKFFLFEGVQGYIRGMAKEFDESPNAIRVEVNHFVEAGLLYSVSQGRKRVYEANPSHPIYDELKSMVQKNIGIDQIMNIVQGQADRLEAAYITGTFANGIDSETIELVLVGHELDKTKTDQLVNKAAKLIERKIIYFVVTQKQMKYFFKDKPALLIWKADA